MWELFYTCVGAGIDCTHIISAGQTAAKTMCSVGQSKLHRHANTGPRLIAFFLKTGRIPLTTHYSMISRYQIRRATGKR